MQNVKALAGPPELQQAAVDAVSSWTYKPYKHFGRLVEVDTTITVNFDMGSGKAKEAQQTKAQAELAILKKSTQDETNQATPAPQN